MIPVNVDSEPNSGYQRLEQQIRWYDRKSNRAQRFYKWVKGGEFILGVCVPFTAKIDGTLTAILGGAVVVLEGLQQINQWQHNWITYRSTCEALRHEKYTYLGRAGVYDGKSDEEARKILAERVESLISTEHAKWISRQEYQTKNKTLP
jgi:Protein of unknown function (DUF4231)